MDWKCAMRTLYTSDGLCNWKVAWPTFSITSIWKLFDLIGNFTVLKILKEICSSLSLKISGLFNNSFLHGYEWSAQLERNILVFMLRIRKSTENINFSTLINTPSKIFLVWVRDQSVSCRVTVVALSSPIPSFLRIESGIKLILASKSYNGLSK